MRPLWRARECGRLKPLVIELFCGSFGWSRGFLEAGYQAVGFDIDHQPHHGPVPNGAELVIQDVLTLHGSQFRNAAVIVASPPCQDFSSLAMPFARSVDWVRPSGDGWEVLNSRARKEMLERWKRQGPDTRLFDACFRIQQEAIEATRKVCPCCAGTGESSYQQPGVSGCGNCARRGFIERYIPMVVENVRGSKPWVGKPFKANFGSFVLYGDVGMVGKRIVRADAGFGAAGLIGTTRKGSGGGWFQGPGTLGGHIGRTMELMRPGGPLDPERSGQKTQGGSWFRERNGEPQPGIRHEDRGARKNNGGSWFGVAHNTTSGLGANPVNVAGHRATDPRDVRKTENSWEMPDGTKIGGDWFSDPNSTCWKHGSRSSARKAASAQIAKIPLDLARHVAEIFLPKDLVAVSPPRNSLQSMEKAC